MLLQHTHPAAAAEIEHLAAVQTVIHSSVGAAEACQWVQGLRKSTLMDAGKGGTSSGAWTSSAKMQPTALDSCTDTLGRHAVSDRTIF